MEEKRRQRAAAQNASSQARKDETEISIDIVELLYRVLAKWKFILCIAIVCAALFGCYTKYFVKPTYKASSSIYVLSRRDTAINMTDLQIGAALTKDYLKVFDIWEVNEQVISNLNLPYSYNQLRRMVSAVNDSGTRILDITVSSNSPEEAATIANEFAEVASQYIADTMSTEKPSIMSVALVPKNPSGYSVTSSAIRGLLIGIVLAAGIVILQYLLDDKIKTAEDIRKYTGYLTLSLVPVDESVDRQSGKRKKTNRREKQ